MNTEIRVEIEGLLNELISLKGILPGSISKQYNVCGTPNCKCKDPENPVKHGPYYQLSYTVSGRNSSKFVKENDLNVVNKMRDNYKRFKEICFQLPGLYIDLFKAESFNAELPDIRSALETPIIEEQKKRIKKLENELTESRKIIHSQQVTIRDSQKSREGWKEKTMESKTKATELEKENISLKRKQVKLESKIKTLIENKKKRH
jgi:hypothetical protein